MQSYSTLRSLRTGKITQDRRSRYTGAQLLLRNKEGAFALYPISDVKEYMETMIPVELEGEIDSVWFGPFEGDWMLSELWIDEQHYRAEKVDSENFVYILQKPADPEKIAEDQFAFSQKMQQALHWNVLLVMTMSAVALQQNVEHEIPIAVFVGGGMGFFYHWMIQLHVATLGKSKIIPFLTSMPIRMGFVVAMVASMGPFTSQELFWGSIAFWMHRWPLIFCL